MVPWTWHKTSSDHDTRVSDHELDSIRPTISKDLILPVAVHHKIKVIRL